MKLCTDDRLTLRMLAERYMSYALSDKNNGNRLLWRSLNDGNMQKPMVAIDQMPWNELDVDSFLACTVKDPYFRRVEWNLRSEIYKWEHLPADMVLNPYILLPRPIANTGYGIRSEYEARAVTDPANSVVSKRYVNQFQEPEDVEKIKTPGTAETGQVPSMAENSLIPMNILNTVTGVRSTVKGRLRVAA